MMYLVTWVLAHMGTWINMYTHPPAARSSVPQLMDDDRVPIAAAWAVTAHYVQIHLLCLWCHLQCGRTSRTRPTLHRLGIMSAFNQNVHVLPCVERNEEVSLRRCMT
jgi:hypothetical protein